ncbi:kynurenine-oxoglutarate transaminase [Stylonychia lemnae]|uniref:Kynurenine-oxoglutarate transaminase n=1 Tax=Stylonychia lemnae TaxID=5949 RepID=A0A078B287_STYLE|nr:kynurenine-oxoglutarate transaminase [Stylonychia lemnae]|eukprot:CDW87563.1 kynurenine-oxoglutarate transaminase [Stylonychia lemnae]
MESKRAHSIERKLPHRVNDYTAIFAEFKDLAEKYKCQSFGEGSPGYNPPDFLKQELIKAVDEGFNQYVRPSGNPLLVNKIAEIYGKRLNRNLNSMTEVLVSNGANACIFVLMQALINEGEEVVAFEPYFPPYLEHIEYAKAQYRTVPLELNEMGEWIFRPELLRQALNSKTKILLLNNAHNPTGKLFTRKELEEISKILDEFPNVIVLCDEVYEFLTYDNNEHLLFANIGNNYNRTLSIFSGGKLFCATGWKIGWTIGPAELLRNAHVISNTIYYTLNSPGQVAFARSLDTIEQPGFKEGLTYRQFMKQEFQNVRDYMYTELKDHMDIPIKPLHSQSGYFMMADISECKDIIPKQYLESHDYEEDKNSKVNRNRVFMEDGRIPLDLAVSRWLALERGVITMPGSLFYYGNSRYKSDNYLRLAICKGMNISKLGIEKLQRKALQAAKKLI